MYTSLREGFSGARKGLNHKRASPKNWEGKTWYWHDINKI